MGVELAVADLDFSLLKALAEAVAGLPGDVLLQRVQLLRRQLARHLTFRHAPEPAVPHLGGEITGLDLLLHAVVFIVIVHEAAFRFGGQPLPHQRGDNVVRIACRRVVVQLRGLVLGVAPFIFLVAIHGHGHIQLEEMRFGRQDGEAVLADDQPKAAAVVPLHMECADVVNAVQRPHRPRLHGVVRVFHFPKPDAAAMRETAPAEKVSHSF
jgi:hypothetical protein